MTMNRHESFEELISASLSGDLSDAERQRLDAHLAGCATCRGTLAAFTDQRRIIAGLRHVAPPRDLDARVRTGIETGRLAGLPWWRRPAVIFAGVGGSLAAVAGALLAIVIINGSATGPDIGRNTPTPTDVIDPSGSVDPSISATPGPSGSAFASPTISDVPVPSASPIASSPEPDAFLALTGPADNQALTVRDGDTGDTFAEVATPAGPPVAAELSPDGRWLAYITELGQSGMNEIRATRITDAPTPGFDTTDSPVAVGDTVVLAESTAGSPSLERMAWSPDGHNLAFTVADAGTSEADAWVFNVGAEEAEPITNVGNAYAGSWVRDEDGSTHLWVSTSGDVPRSYLMSISSDGPSGAAPSDPAEGPYPAAENVFQPLVSPNGALVIFWSGRMEQDGSQWLFSEGGAPWLAENAGDGTGGYEFVDARELFSDLSIGRSAFASAAITWGADGDALAVWDVDWLGTSQGPAEEVYPDPGRVYFGHATDSRGLTRTHAIDVANMADDERAVDVKVAATARHLLITAARPRAGVLDPPSARLLLVTRNTGEVADDVQPLNPPSAGWYGPAVFANGSATSSP